jgi:hypothetical protein
MPLPWREAEVQRTGLDCPPRAVGGSPAAQAVFNCWTPARKLESSRGTGKGRPAMVGLSITWITVLAPRDTARAMSQENETA